MLRDYESEVTVSNDTHGSVPMETDAHMNMPKKESRGTQLNKLRPTRRSVASQTKPKRRTVGIQTSAKKPTCSAIGIQCNMKYAEYTGRVMMPSNGIHKDTHNPIREEEEEPPFSDDDAFSFHDNSSDSDYVMPEEEEASDANDENYDDAELSSMSPAHERKYIVFESNLLSLFSVCQSCCAPTTAEITQRVGSMITIHQECVCGYLNKWTSQPLIGNTPAGNLLLSAGILFSGSIPSKALRFLYHANVAAISKRTFNNHQSSYLHPVVSMVWTKCQEKYFTEMRAKRLPLTVGGDGRADSPGHSAKYGSYTLLDMDYMLVIDVQLVQSNEVKSSVHMEKEGLVRSMAKMKEEQMMVGELVTDRHSQIVKYVREEMPHTTHCFDVWHVAKGLKKKLTALSRLKQCEAITPWIRSITNHMYWVPASTPDGHEDTMWEKWKSITGHISNVHTQNGKYFKRCEHEPLEGKERKKKWLQPGTLAFEKLQDLLTTKQMEKDVRKLSPGAQTAVLEAYHSIVNHFAPKMIGFSFHGMHSRLLLAALHYNENGQRAQAETKDGDKRSAIIYPKYKKGECTKREIKVECTYGYVHKLMDTLLQYVEDDEKQTAPHIIGQSPPPLCSQYKKAKVDDVRKLTRY